MRELLAKRIDLATFAEDKLIDRLIEYSGGHPRELLQLLRMACELTESDRIEAPTVERSIDKLATDFRYWLQPEDDKLLAEVDAKKGAHVSNNERTRNLFWRLGPCS